MAMLPAVLLSLTVALAPQAQDDKQKLSSHRKTSSQASGLVTDAEARQVFLRAEKMMRRVTKSQAKVPAVAIPNSGNAVTRDKVVLEFARLYDIAKPKFKLIPKPTTVNLKVLKMSNPAAKAKLTLLIERGAIGNYGPLATGPTEKLTIAEFGDALGLFLGRMAEMTHLPTTYSPSIMPTGIGGG